ncbi:polyprenyl synthetase family protein [Streptomyces sp. NPDC049813]|uniref:polyprenyl synthetase family protein n=1 Tax=Streptomyces sp. NPDC049813 TaxID=3365597 RepID=UPI0037AED14D
MPPDEATGAATAVVPHDGADRVANDLSARVGRAPVPVRARQVDADVTGTVERRLALLLARRVAEAGSVDAVFGVDVAERVARFTLAGGRRIRPQFLWWGLRACGPPDDGQIDAALPLAVALELLQTCALVHDDVMDRAPTRRSRPALHADYAAQYAPPGHPGGARFGESAAILAGDLALAWADDEVAALPLPARRAGAIRRTWSRMRMEMVAGQYLDVQGELTRDRSLGQALGVACLKTARYTVERPLQLGAVLGGADEPTLRALCAAGRGAGLAFQLRDDLDDVFPGAARRGKPAGGDLRAGKPTYLVALAHARAEAAGDRTSLRVLEHCLGRPGLDESGLSDVRHVLEHTGARQDVEEKIRTLTARSLRHLDAAPLDPLARARLRTLVRQAAGPGAPPGGAKSAPGGAASAPGGGAA